MLSEDDFHHCLFCGEYVKDGYKYNGTRHFLSDCRPDLVEHGIGDTCTWAFRRTEIRSGNGTIIPPLPLEETCYAYQDKARNWTKDHTHFYKDGPM